MAGIWDVRIETFIKAPPQVWTFSGSDDDLQVVVQMDANLPASQQGDMTITDAKLVGSTFTWTLHVTKPAKITTKGTATLSPDGQTWEGTAKAGILPGGKFTGVKRAVPAPAQPAPERAPAAYPYAQPATPSAPAAPATPAAPAAPTPPSAPSLPSYTPPTYTPPSYTPAQPAAAPAPQPTTPSPIPAAPSAPSYPSYPSQPAAAPTPTSAPVGPAQPAQPAAPVPPIPAATPAPTNPAATSPSGPTVTPPPTSPAEDAAPARPEPTPQAPWPPAQPPRTF